MTYPMTTATDVILSGIRALRMQAMGSTKVKGGRLGTKQVPCGREGCSDRRTHHEDPDTPRGTQYVEVKANHTGPAFCSLNCMFYYKGMLKENNSEEIY